MQKKTKILSVVFSGVVLIGIVYLAFWANNRSLARFLEKLYFVSTVEELKVVQQDILKNDLKGGIAIFLRFYKDGGHKDEIDKLVEFFHSTHYLPVFVYDDSEFYDFAVADRLLRKEIRGCKPMGCAYVLKLGGGEDDRVSGCTSTGMEPRKLVEFGLKSLRNFVKK